MLLRALHVLLAATLQIIPSVNVSGLVTGAQLGKLFYFSFALPDRTKQHLNNTILYTCLGNNYKVLGQNTEAEQAYLHAWHMAPARFYPLYLLAKLYNETGQTEKALTMAKK